ncbi:MAG TPA: hypothetical protein VN462_05905 [Negativicutes bacterium]|nr:hypothetical protein [Negativicutes bacterium]
MKFTAAGIIARRRELWEANGDIELDRDFTVAVAERIASEEGGSLREEIAAHPELLIEMVFVVVDKKQRTVPFFLNDIQRSFIEDLNRAIVDFQAGRRVDIKFLILKSRQQGFTSLITAYQLACSITRRNYAGFTLADTSDNTESIFEDKAKFPYNSLPTPLKPTEKYNTRRELLFEMLNSKWRVATAGNKDVGRSKTLKFFHGSEAAFWAKGIDSIMTGLGQAMTQDSIQILETTPNGYNEYKDLWDDAVINDNNWEANFYTWWLTGEYRQEFESPAKEQEFQRDVANAPPVKEKYEANTRLWVMQKCRWLLDDVGLGWDQIYWYYNKWKDLKEKVQQEYPCTAEEAFLASGRCVFNKEIIILRIAALKKLYKEQPPKRGRFSFAWNDAEAQDFIKDSSIKWVDDPAGPIRIYEEPQKGWPYVIGGDTKGEGKDFYGGTVINNISGNRCASLHMQLNSSKPFSWQMYCLGRYYENALIGIEMNFNTAPIEELERLRYPRQYKREVYDTYKNKKEEKHGWRTDRNTRPLIIDHEEFLIGGDKDHEGHPELFNDISTLQGMLTFVYDKNNRPDAENLKHDDLLFSDMIGEEIRGQQRRHVLDDKPLPRSAPRKARNQFTGY